MKNYQNNPERLDVKTDYRSEGKDLLEAYRWFKDEEVLQSFTDVCAELIQSGGFENKKHLEILGIGSGTGLLENRVNQTFQKQGFSTKLIMSDVLPEVVAQSRELYANQTDIQYLQMDAKALSLAENTQDLVVARSVHHYEPTSELEQKVLSEVKRILKPNGYFIDQAPTFSTTAEANLLKDIHSLLPKKLSASSKDDVVNILSQYFEVQEIPSEQQAKRLVTTKQSFLQRYNIVDPLQIKLLSEEIILKILNVPPEERPNVWCDADNLDFGWAINMTTFVCKKATEISSERSSDLQFQADNNTSANLESYQSFQDKYGEERANNPKFIENVFEGWSSEVLKDRQISDVRINSHMIFPAHKEAHYEKVVGLEGIHRPNVILLDLEDAVADELKPRAREVMRSFLTNQAYFDKIKSKYLVGVRVNNYRSPEYQADLEAIRDLDLDFLILPKVEDAKEIESARQDTGVKNLMVVIETLVGHDKRRELISAMQPDDVLIVGYEDLCGDLNISRQSLYDNSNLLRRYLEDIIVEAKMRNVTIIDCVTRGYEKEGIEELVKESQLTAGWGLPAKMCINPKQLAIVNQAYILYKLARLNEISQVLEQTQSQGQNALGKDGELVSTRSILKPRDRYRELTSRS